MKENKKWVYENLFFQTSNFQRISKMIAQYELYKEIVNIPGDVFEFGVFKGISFIKLISFRNILETEISRKIIGFDTFGDFPNDSFDKEFIKDFSSSAGKGCSLEEMDSILKNKNFRNYELVKGDIRKTLPEYLENHKEITISFLHLDVDVYSPTSLILELLFERVVRDGIIVFDNYGTVKGETVAVNEFLKKHPDYSLKKLSFSNTPSFLVKK